jgi:hypothetical protein
MGTKQDGGHLQAKSRGLRMKSTLLASWSWTSQPPELWENKLLLFKPHSLWYFVMAAQADQDNLPALFSRGHCGNCLETWLASYNWTDLPGTSRDCHHLSFGGDPRPWSGPRCKGSLPSSPSPKDYVVRMWVRGLWKRTSTRHALNPALWFVPYSESWNKVVSLDLKKTQAHHVLYFGEAVLCSRGRIGLVSDKAGFTFLLFIALIKIA